MTDLPRSKTVSQPNSCSSPSAPPPVAKSVAKSRAYRKYVLFFAVLFLVASIFYFSSSVLWLHTIYAGKQVGECFKFGRYPQGPNGEIKPITWRVLQREKDYLLVVSEKGLECRAYNTDIVTMDWASCTLRSWLNSEFYDKAFNEQERKCILRTRIANNAGPNTEDYIFLLSVDEARILFANNRSRRAELTEFAAKNGAYVYDGCCVWWLRTRGFHDYDTAYVRISGIIGSDGHGIDDVFNAVRPALKLAL